MNEMKEHTDICVLIQNSGLVIAPNSNDDCDLCVLGQVVYYKVRMNVAEELKEQIAALIGGVRFEQIQG